MRRLLAGFLVFAGVAHFFKTGSYVKILPSWVLFPEAVVLVSGAICSLLGVGLLVKRFSRTMAWGIIIYLIAVFPVNVHMALNPGIFPNVPEWVLWMRLPLQAVLIGWAYLYTH